MYLVSEYCFRVIADHHLRSLKSTANKSRLIQAFPIRSSRLSDCDLRDLPKPASASFANLGWKRRFDYSHRLTSSNNRSRVFRQPIRNVSTRTQTHSLLHGKHSRKHTYLPTKHTKTQINTGYFFTPPGVGQAPSPVSLGALAQPH
jgi:hypothetical protein